MTQIYTVLIDTIFDCWTDSYWTDAESAIAEARKLIETGKYEKTTVIARGLNTTGEGKNEWVESRDTVVAEMYASDDHPVICTDEVVKPKGKLRV